MLFSVIVCSAPSNPAVLGHTEGMCSAPSNPAVLGHTEGEDRLVTIRQGEEEHS